MLTHLILDELQPNPVVAAIDPITAGALRQTKLVAVDPAWGGGYSIATLGLVGAVQVGNLLVEVKPKARVGLDRMLFLLGYAKDPGFREEDVTGEGFDDLFSALALALARQGERALARGPLAGYLHLDDALRTVRGRIRVTDQVTRRPGMLLPLEVSYDEYTEDIPENRIVRTAIRLALRLPRLSDDARRRLAHLDAKLGGVTILSTGAPLPRWTASRANAHYKPALRLAELMLHNMSAETGTGGLTVASFIVDMAKVFEDFVTVALTEALASSPGRTDAQYQCYLDVPSHQDSSRVNMYVDLVYSVGGVPQTIFDAKYKASGATGYSNADQYQMLAYCTALGVKRAWLIYADSGQVRPREIRNSNVEIVECPLDLSLEPNVILAKIRILTTSVTAEPSAYTASS
ncbi:5-methylcytosine-specific restriction enzyme subunit McrC [Sinomonas atrocyanea]|uniref:McrC family protein n=1 Tax=Sinomonas atrocyanea TaxID=37927 RepID=UPI002787700C|nr:restriction endonuclease [Sinomonas atrocyanea]MDQ0260454.1 5-methylcytosine-specific restriction enzyme subunit McrC [Sinomonas atrocyanea]